MGETTTQVLRHNPPLPPEGASGQQLTVKGTKGKPKESMGAERAQLSTSTRTTIELG